MGKIVSFDGRIGFYRKARKILIRSFRTLVLKQVAPTLKLLQEADRILGRDFVQEGIENAELNDEQQSYLEWMGTSGGKIA